MKIKKLFTLLTAIVLMGLLAACACEHQWQPATCLAPRTCALCGVTQGKVRAHTWGRLRMRPGSVGSFTPAGPWNT